MSLSEVVRAEIDKQKRGPNAYSPGVKSRAYQKDNKRRPEVPNCRGQMHSLHTAAKHREDGRVEQRGSRRLVGDHIGVQPCTVKHANRRKRAHAFIAVYEIVTDVEHPQQEVQQEESAKHQHQLTGRDCDSGIRVGLSLRFRFQTLPLTSVMVTSTRMTPLLRGAFS